VRGYRRPKTRSRSRVFLQRDLLLYGPLGIFRRIWPQILALAAMFLLCAWVFQYYNGIAMFPTGLLDSVSTITTIGIYAPPFAKVQNSSNEQIVLIAIFLISVGIAASLVQGVVSQAADRELWTEETLRREVARMKDHVIVMGYSHLGRYAHEKLNELGVPHVVVTRHAESIPQLRREKVPAFAARVAEFHKILEEVGLRRASTVICAFDEDPDNLIATLYANKVNPDLRIVTTVHDRSLEASARLAGADVVIPTSNLLGELLGLAAVSEEVAGVLFSDRVPAKYIAEFLLPPRGAFTFGELNAIAPVLLVLQDGRTLANPSNDFVVKGGSTIFVLANPDDIERVRHRLRRATELGGPEEATRRPPGPV
jgi:voltage-gated potassium channel